MSVGIYPNNKRVKRGRDKKFPTMFLRFKEKYKIVESGCWEWQAALNSKGYGSIGDDNGKNISAHRYSYQIFIGEIYDNNGVLHKCDNPKCVNPFHLFAGTQLDNSLDCIKKGRRKASPHPSIWHYNKGCRCDECNKLKYDYNVLRNSR